MLSTDVKNLVKRYNLTNLDTTISELEVDFKVDSKFFLELFHIFAQEKLEDVSQLRVFPTAVILDYLKQTHRYYLDTKLPEMELITSQLAKEFDKNNAAVLNFFFLKFSTELKKHIDYEDNIVFPYIKTLLDGEIPESGRNAFRLIKFENFHSHDVEDHLTEFREHLTSTFSDLKDSFAFKHFSQHTLSFEKDLKIHAMIEDLVVIPIAKELEASLLQN